VNARRPPSSDARIVARDRVIDRIQAVLRDNSALAVHLIGSLGRQSADELSDVDVWATFDNDAIAVAIERRMDLYRSVGPVLLCHETPSNRPLGGSYSLVLHDTEAGPLQVDYYFAPLRTSRVNENSLTLFENIAIPRGEWILDVGAQNTSTRSERLDFLILMTFIGIKKIARGDEQFPRFLERVYDETAANDGLDLGGRAEIRTIGDLMKNLDRILPRASEGKELAILRVRNYGNDVSQLRITDR
jgi:hypothetical protein